jgi:hypothetical protein
MGSITRKIHCLSRRSFAVLLISVASAIVLVQRAGGTLPVVQKAGAVQATSASEAPFLSENAAAMNKMMADMAAKPSGDIDRDFVAMMEPHHQGAIDMAQAFLRHGSNEQLKRLAQEIVVTQQQEIAAMRLAIGDPLPPSVPSPTQPARAVDSQSTPPGAMQMFHDTIKTK